MSRSPGSQPASQTSTTQPPVTPNTAVVKTAHSASNSPRPDPRVAAIDSDWEPVIDRATD